MESLGSNPAIPIIVFCFSIALITNVLTVLLNGYKRRKQERLNTERKRLEAERERLEEARERLEATREVVVDADPPAQSPMKVVRCKGCGANNKIAAGEISECQYCGAFIQ